MTELEKYKKAFELACEKVTELDRCRTNNCEFEKYDCEEDCPVLKKWKEIFLEQAEENNNDE